MSPTDPLNLAFAYAVLGAEPLPFTLPQWFLDAYCTGCLAGNVVCPLFFKDWRALEVIIVHRQIALKTQHFPRHKEPWFAEIIRPEFTGGRNATAFGHSLPSAVAGALLALQSKQTKTHDTPRS